MRLLNNSIRNLLVGVLFFALFSVLALNSVIRVSAENEGSVKTVANCSDVNINPFNSGDIVRGRGSDFITNKDYKWAVVKVDQPGKDTQVSDGTFYLDGTTTSFCFVIWNPSVTLLGDPHSEFKWSVERKDQKCTGPVSNQRCEDQWNSVDSDNFFVDAVEGQTTPSPEPCVQAPEGTPCPTSTSVPVPSPTLTPEPTNSPVPTGQPGPKVCDAKQPPAPLLLTVTRTSPTTVLLKWAPVTPSTYYVISYGTDPNNMQFGVPNTGNTDNFTIGALNPNLNYYFTLRAVNDCMPSDPSAVLGTETVRVLGASTGQVLGASTEKLAATDSNLELPRAIIAVMTSVVIFILAKKKMTLNQI